MASSSAVPATPAPSPEPEPASTIPHSEPAATWTCSGMPEPSPELELPPDSILRTQTIQVVEHIQSSDRSAQGWDWVGCLIPVRELTFRPQHGPVHVVGIDGDKAHLAVSRHYLPELRNHVSLELCAKKPCIKEEMASTHEAKERAWYRLGKVIEAIERHGAGLGRFYRPHIRNNRLRMVIEGAILMWEINASCPGIRRRFWLACVFISLHLVPSQDSEAAYEVLRRTDGTWTDILETASITAYSDSRESRHRIALLRTVLMQAGGARDAIQLRIDEAKSVNDCLEDLGDLFAIDVEVPEFRGFGNRAVSATLRQYKPFGCTDEEVNELESFRPVGFSKELYEHFPAARANNVPSKIMVAAQLTVAHEDRQNRLDELNGYRSLVAG